MHLFLVDEKCHPPGIFAHSLSDEMNESFVKSLLCLHLLFRADCHTFLCFNADVQQ